MRSDRCGASMGSCQIDNSFSLRRQRGAGAGGHGGRGAFVRRAQSADAHRLLRPQGRLQDHDHPRRRPRILAGQDPDIQLLFGGSDDTMQVRDPSDRIAVTDRGSHTIALMVLEDGKVAFHTSPTPDAISRCAT